MRIDLNVVALAQVPADRDTKQVKSTGSSASHASSAASASISSSSQPEDKATLSSSALLRSSLAAAALKLPPVRLEKVDALSQALHSGQYEINPSKIADAIVRDRLG